MTETLSAEEIQDFREQIKRDMKTKEYSMRGINYLFLERTMDTIEAKDAQIRALVEALTEIDLKIKQHFDMIYCAREMGSKATFKHEYSDTCIDSGLIASKALSSIEAETVKLYRLEREVVENAELMVNFEGVSEDTTISQDAYERLVACTKKLITEKKAHKEGKR